MHTAEAREGTMASKLTLLAGFGAGYVLGARAGRGRYDEIVGKARDVWQDPRVQDKLPGTTPATS